MARLTFSRSLYSVGVDPARRCSGSAAGGMSVEIGTNAMGGRRRAVGVVLAGVAGLVLSQVAIPGAQAEGSVQAWEASANSAVVGISPSSSGVYLTSTIGQAYSAYDQSETQATSALVNLGGLGYAVASSPICGQAITLKQQPQPLSADSANGPSSATTQAQLFPGVKTPPGSGTEHVSVSVKPESAEARTYPVTQDVPGVVHVEGIAQSEVHYVDGQAQNASASVAEDVGLLGGKVVIDGLKWSASQQRGSSEPTNKATFSYGSITVVGVGGIPVTIPGTVPIGTALAGVNGLLATLGVTISLPAESVDPGTGTVSMSPLQVHFSGSALDNQLASPAVGPLTQVINALNGQVTHGADCSQLKNLLGQLSTVPETGLTLLMSSLEGAGAVDLFFGGASADTLAAPSFTNPFDFGGSPSATPLPPSGLSGVPLTAPGSGLSSPSMSNLPGYQAATPATGSTAVAPRSGGSQQSVRTVGLVKCVTTSPRGGSGCWRGLASVAAVAVVLLGSALLAADAVYNHRQPRPRRRRRRLRV